MSLIPGVPGVGRADEVVDAARTAERLGDAAEAAGDLTGTTARVASDLTHVRTPYDIGGVHYEVNTGHGFHREHTGPGGVKTDLRTTNLTPEAIEQSILGHVQSNLPAVQGITRGQPPFTGRVVVDGRTIEYRAMPGPDGTIYISSYYLIP
jgi:hypothetical protein